MCELMGLSVEQRISAEFSFKEFAGRDHANLDGWGLAWYPDRSAALIKEPVPWRSSAQAVFLETYCDLLSSIYIAHVRHKTVGGRPTHADTHPFMREYGGRDYCFAHNGTLSNLPAYGPNRRYSPVGNTDSEEAFCLILNQLSDRGRLDCDENFQWFHRELLSLNRCGKINCLMSDGEFLFCYHDTGGHAGLAWTTMGVPAHHPKHFEDKELEVAFESGKPIEAFLVATRPLGKSEWKTFRRGELIVAKKGRIIYSRA